MGPWFTDSCHLRYFLLWHPMNMAPDGGSGYTSLWICFLELLLIPLSAFTLCSCYYPKPYRSGFCLLGDVGLHIAAPRRAFLFWLSHCNISQAVAGGSGLQRRNVSHLGAVESTIGTQHWHQHPGNSDTGCQSHPLLLFVTLYPQSP